MPVGPSLPQIASVSQGGVPVANKAVTITLSGGGSVGGTTDAAGEFRFTYKPPGFSTVEHLTGTCTGCTNTAQKDITVAACEVCPGEAGAAIGNPITPINAEKLQPESDWSDGAAHPLDFSRRYRSGGAVLAGLGTHWSHNYAAALITNGDEAIVRLGTGKTVLLTRTGSGAPWQADTGTDTLATVANGTLYTRGSDQSRWLFDANDRLVSITQRNGWTMTLGYTGTQLTSITNAFGRVLQLAYDASGRLSSVTPPGAGAITYGYDASNRLVSASYPGGASRGYLYENTTWPQALTGLTDEGGQRYATFGYDTYGRAVSTAHAGGVQSYSVDYGSTPATGTLVAGHVSDPSQPQSSVTVTDPLGTQQTFGYVGGMGRVQVSGASNAAGGAQTASRSFGPSTLPSQETDFLGNVTTYTWDTARQLPLTVTKASGKPEAQTTSTQWHPNFRLPSLVTESNAAGTPLRSTAYTYDTNGNLINQTTTEIATSRTRTTQWSYNAQGLVQTMTDPRNNVWTYGYDAQGNRTSVTNPLSQTTTYGYDAAGYLTSMTDPNGAVTNYTYDARQRLLTASVAGQTTTYTYHPTGQLKRVTAPDGSWLDYEYDGAQRLTAITDKLNNRIDYTLDAMGNRTGEQVKDPGGVLRRQIQRSVNALNRLQQTTGEF